jgi:hypothetical protein
MVRKLHRNQISRIVPLIALLSVCHGLWPQSKPKAEPDNELPLAAEQTAQAIGVTPLFNQIKELASQRDPANQLRLLFVQQQALMQITAASLQIDAAAGRIDLEIGETRELQSYLSSRRDSRVDKLNLATLLVGGATGTVSSALGFTSHDNAAAAFGVAGGVAATTLSLIALHISRGESHELLVQSNMLSEVFDRPSDVNNVYPPIFISFMNATAPSDEDGLSRQDRLIHDWITTERIPEPKSAKGREKIDHVTSLPGQKVKQSIADLDDRQAMLYDLRARLNYLKQDLAILLASLATMTPTINISPPPVTSTIGKDKN